MEIDLALLADAATIDASGKLNILGIFDRLGLSDFPGRHGRMSLVLRFRAGIDRAGRHELGIVLKGPEGEEVVRADGSLQFGPGSEAAREGIVVPQVFNLDGLVFQAPGRYAFDILVDGEHHATVPLRVVSTGSGRA